MKRVVAVASAFIFDDDNRILLGKFTKKFNQAWSMPGGKVDFGESLKETLLREVKEETNIDISGEPIFCGNGTFTWDSTHYVYSNYLAKFNEGSKVILNEEFSEYSFFSRDQIADLYFIREIVRDELNAAFDKIEKGLTYD